ncbi:MAG: HupE/UreJ family protein [Burkholderiaceae bacterium]
MKTKAIHCAALIVLVSVPLLALAHEERGQAAGFVAGLAHPVSGLDHVLAMVAVGLWGAVLGVPAIWVLPVAFPLVMAVGGLLGLLGVPLPGVELGIAVSAVVLGAMVLAEARPPLALAAVVVAFFAIFHGHAHGTEVAEGASALLYSLGFVVATGLLHAAGILIGVLRRWPAGRVLVRAAGGGVGLAGLFFLWRALA